MEIVDTAVFRVTRDADFTVSDEADDLLQAVEDELRRRRFGEVVRVEVEAGHEPRACASSSMARARGRRATTSSRSTGCSTSATCGRSSSCPGFPELRDPPWTPVTQPRLQADEGEQPDVMAAMREGDMLVHHPYDSFATSVERFVEQAVADPDVLAIKQTVYRTSDDSPLVPALIRAAERGKQAVCLVELKARFDERANIRWARALEEAGVHVVYGLPGAQDAREVRPRRAPRGRRRAPLRPRRDRQLPPDTARLYTDFGLFTCDERIGADVADMFNFLTGYARPRRYRQVLVAPRAPARRDPRRDRARRSRRTATGSHARIAMKMNSLVDRRCIRALYARLAGGRAGRPQRARDLLPAPGRARRVGEHPRRSRSSAASSSTRASTPSSAATTRTVYIGSADLMPRNLDTRVELLVPVARRRRCATSCSTRSSAASPTTRTPGSSARRRLDAPPRPSGAEPRDVQRELMRATPRARPRPPPAPSRTRPSPLPFQPARVEQLGARDVLATSSTQVWPRRRQVDDLAAATRAARG